jgi:Leucine-rich repeat (LRR) protein
MRTILEITPNRSNAFFSCLAEHLLLSTNGITGTLPPTIGDLSRLKELDYSSNFVAGLLPPSISGISGLEFLAITFNAHTGTMPTTIGALKSLKSLRMGDNNFSGVIPTEIGNMIKLGTQTRMQLLRNKDPDTKIYFFL